MPRCEWFTGSRTAHRCASKAKIEFGGQQLCGTHHKIAVVLAERTQTITDRRARLTENDNWDGAA